MKLTIDDLQVENQSVLMRVDFNVPLRDGHVTNDKRIRAALPTIQALLERGAKLTLMSHLGRPKGSIVPEMSLRPCAQVLEDYLGQTVYFSSDCIGQQTGRQIGKLKAGQILLLENLRFHAEETQNDADFARHLATGADLFVNDAFGTAHRAHASTVGVTHHIDTCAAGYLMKKELDCLGQVLNDPAKPFVAVLGGAKITGKIDVINNLLSLADTILIGGGMMFTFLKAKGLEIGNSLLEANRVAMAAELLAQAAKQIVLPTDCLVTDHLDVAQRQLGAIHTSDVDAIAPGAIGVDIGPQTIAHFKTILAAARTIVWNGPMGIFEIDGASQGTLALASALAECTSKGALSVVGGGDSAAAVAMSGLTANVSHVSTGGGASLDLLAGRRLPGVEALTDR
jgi:phosphoglycerate kinase